MVVDAPSADAATGYDRCHSGHMCLFAEENRQGAMAFFEIGSPDLALQNFDNRTRSWRNRHTSSFCMYVNVNYDNSAGADTFQPGTWGLASALPSARISHGGISRPARGLTGAPLDIETVEDCRLGGGRVAGGRRAALVAYSDVTVAQYNDHNTVIVEP
ncbi:peptidase inhibitor family I36 protein [Amycolatopsis sp. cmx-11-12]|uniref:peptidase inhibitor family I36 protein n=1 Tax=Amycolatopsis sp. cmx-11-12 TaxID=2785795 RepID=UPI003918623C